MFLAVLENSVLPMGRDSSHKTQKVSPVVYKHQLCAVTKNYEFGVGRSATLIVKQLKIIIEILL